MHLYVIGYDVADSIRRTNLRDAIKKIPEEKEGCRVANVLESQYFIFSKDRIDTEELRDQLKAHTDGRHDNLLIGRLRWTETFLFGSSISLLNFVVFRVSSY